MKIYKSLEELRDSELLYEKTLPAFGYAILMVIMFVIICVIAWSTNTPKSYIVTASGNAQSNNKNLIMSPYTGEIVNMNISEGAIVERGEALFTIKSVDLDLQLEQLSTQSEIYQKQLLQLKKLVDSIIDDKNYFSSTATEDSLYYSQFELYKSQIVQQRIDVSSYKAYGYTDEQIKNEVLKNQDKISEIYYSAIKTTEEQIMQAQSQLDSINSQVEAIESGKSNYIVRASETGTVHMLGEYKEGMIVQTASPIASIGSESDEYHIVAYILAPDAARVEIDNDVEISISGIAQTIYGTLTGKISKIDSDITIPQGSETSSNAMPYFKTIIIPDSYYLISNDGHKINLSNGLSVEVRIIYDKLSYFDYVLESLGLLIRGQKNEYKSLENFDKKFT